MISLLFALFMRRHMQLPADDGLGRFIPSSLLSSRD